MKKKISIKKDIKNRTELMLFLLFACFTLCLSVGYAALNSDLKISGEANFRVVKDIRITDVSLYETTNLGLESYTSKYSKDTITIGSDLKQVNSTISYKVKVQNSGTVVMWIDSIEETKNNDNIEYVLEGIGIKEFINPGEEKEFTLKIKYKDGITVLPSSTNIDTILKFNFIKPESTLAQADKSDQTNPFYNGSIAKEKIESIEFRPTLDVVDNAVGSWDASLDRNGTVIASYTDSDKNGLYELYIGGIGIVNAPADSSYLFRYFNNLTKINFNKYFNTSSVTSMLGMFNKDAQLASLDVSSFNTSKVTNMRLMFSECNVLTKLDLSNFDTSNVTDMKAMFQACHELVNLNISSFNTPNLTDMQNMFSECNKLRTIDVSRFDTSKVTDMRALFQSCFELTNVDLSYFNTSKVVDMRNMFYECKNILNLNLSSFNTANVVDMQYMFYGCKSLSNLDLTSFDTSNVTNMNAMFQNCNGIINLNVSSFNTSKVKNMASMFRKCTSIKELNISSFDTTEVTNMAWLFSEMNNLETLNLSNFNTTNVINMQNMFWYCKKITSLNLSNFDTTNVTNMSNMFSQCTELTNIDVKKFKTEKVINMGSMFFNCASLIKLDLSSFNTSKVTDISAMFWNCKKLQLLDLSNFEFSDSQKIISASYSIFDYVPTSSLIYVKDNASKEFILGVRSDLSNVQVKSA